MTKTRSRLSARILTVLMCLIFAVSCLSLRYSPMTINHKPPKRSTPQTDVAEIVPNTADDSTVSLWLGLGCISSISLLGVCIYLARQK